MNAITEFFTKLLGVHLLFWNLSFKFFDAIPIFVALLGILGMNDLISTQGLKETGNYVILQFIIFALCFGFCYVWSGFRDRYREVAVNMICLSLSIAFLASVFALVAKFMLVLPALRSTFGAGLERFIYGDLVFFPFDVKDSFTFILFLIAYLFILANTLITEGWQQLNRAVLSLNIVPIAVSVVFAFLASIIVAKPIILSMP